MYCEWVKKNQVRISSCDNFRPEFVENTPAEPKESILRAMSNQGINDFFFCLETMQDGHNQYVL